MKYSASLQAAVNSAPVGSVTARSKPARFISIMTSTSAFGSLGAKTIRGMLAPLRADHADERHALARRAAQVVGERELAPASDAGDLPLPGLAAQLQPALEQHPEPRRADRMTERLETSVGIHGQLALEIEGAGEDFLPAGAARREAEVFHQDELGRREAVVDLGHRELLPGVLDARLCVGVGGRGDDLLEGGVVVVRIDRPRRR